MPVATGWAIGARSTGTERFSQGGIDDARIYDRDLSAGEISQIAGAYDNMAPTATGDSGLVASAAGIDDVVAQVSASDPVTAETFTYAITGGDSGGIFAVDNQGTVTVADPVALRLDAADVWTLDVTATDNGPSPLSDTTAVTVQRDEVLDGLLGNWRFDETPGATTTTDWAGDNDGTLQADAAMVTDAPRAVVLSLDGTGA
ncbi:MAG: cadherin repeat domain-containing protein, partial [Planctomycetes bacterium]|nr:cadherin repeat domain-containing protein [Planctomycetota bacterium]